MLPQVVFQSTFFGNYGVSPWLVWLCRMSLCAWKVPKEECLTKPDLAVSPPLLTRQKVPWPILCSCDQLARREKRFVASHNNGMPTCEITIYIGYRSTSPLNLSLLMNLATIEGRVTGVGDGLRRGPPPSRLQSLVEEKNGTFSCIHAKWYRAEASIPRIH